MLRSYNEPGTRVRKWWFNPVALKAGIERDPDETEAALGEQRLLIEDLEKKLSGLRQAHIALKRKTGAALRTLGFRQGDGESH